ncbi:MAG: SufE family protein [Bacteroidota bacterium]
MPLPPKLQTFVDELGSLDDKMLRYTLLLDYADALGDYPAEGKVDTYLVPGCVSRVWLDARHHDGVMHYRAAAEGQIAEGMVAMLVNGLHGETPEAVVAVDPSFIREAGLSESLTPARQGGLASMLKRMQQAARQHVGTADRG